MTDTLTPAPRYTDYTCPHCKAGIGKPCRFGSPRRPHLPPVHAGRYDKWRRSYDRWIVGLHAEEPQASDTPLTKAPQLTS